MNLQKTIKVKIEDLGKIITGNTPPTSDENNYGGKYPFIKPTDMNIDQRYVYEYEDSYSEQAYKRYRNSYIPKGSTGVVTIGTVGEKMFQAHEDCFTNQSVNCVIPYEDKFDKNYIYYLLKFNIEKVSEANPGTASGRHHVSKSNFMSIKVDIFEDINIQKKISKILSNYDDLIENNQKKIILLEEKARLIYEEWFLEFRIDGQKLNIDENTGLPLGWKKKALSTFIKFKKGKSSKEIFDNYEIGLLPLLSLDSLESKEYKYVKEEKQIVALRHDILMLMDGARSSLVVYSEKGAVGSTLALIETKKIPSSLLFHYLKVRFELLQVNNTGAAIPHANKSFINKMEIIVPNDEVLLKWEEIINSINEEIYNLEDQNKLLKESRDILLPRLMTGMIDVDKMDIEV